MFHQVQMKRSCDVDDEFELAELETQQRNKKSENLPLLGHVFISYADMTKIACDALIAINVVTHYTIKYPLEMLTVKHYKLTPLSPTGNLTQETLDKFPYLFQMESFLSIDRIIAELDLALAQATQFLSTQKIAPKFRRAKHLIAIPVVGTGMSGHGGVAGRVCGLLLDILEHWARMFDMDFVLVCYDKLNYHAALKFRKQKGVFFDNNVLSLKLKQNALTLASQARAGHLAIFIGAGCSLATGLPSWNALLSNLGKLGNMTEDEIKALDQLNTLDQARIVAKRIGGVERMNEEICKMLVSPIFGLTHTFLNSIPCGQYITTNYDTLMEQAAVHTKPLVVLPYQRHEHSTNFDKNNRWILKMHGCVHHKEDIVLTREDYHRYQSKRGALAGIVQAQMFTKHMLFIGFSLIDPNFNTIADTVKDSIPQDPTKPERYIGSSIQLRENKLLDELWEGSIHILNMGDKDCPIADAGRRLEIFLDYLTSYALSCEDYLFNPSYETLLNDEEAKFAAEVAAFFSKSDNKNTRGYQVVKECLTQYGYVGHMANVDRSTRPKKPSSKVNSANNSSGNLRTSQDPTKPTISVYYAGASKPKLLPDYLKDLSLNDIVEYFMNDSTTTKMVFKDVTNETSLTLEQSAAVHKVPYCSKFCDIVTISKEKRVVATWKKTSIDPNVNPRDSVLQSIVQMAHHNTSTTTPSSTTTTVPVTLSNSNSNTNASSSTLNSNSNTNASSSTLNSNSNPNASSSSSGSAAWSAGSSQSTAWTVQPATTIATTTISTTSSASSTTEACSTAPSSSSVSTTIVSTTATTTATLAAPIPVSSDAASANAVVPVETNPTKNLVPSAVCPPSSTVLVTPVPTSSVATSTK